MVEVLKVQYDVIESKRLGLINILNEYSIEELNRSPEEGVWSPMQIVEHLCKAEHLSVIYVSKKYNAIGQLKAAGVVEHMKMVWLKWVLGSGIKMKAPKITQPERSDLDASLLDEWGIVRHNLNSVLELFDEVSYKKRVFRHAFAGRVNILHMLQFFEAHLDHHQKQILERLPIE